MTINQLWFRRYQRASKVALWLRLVPFVRLVGLNGSLVTGSMHGDSDIDFYIATAPRRLYTCRALVTMVVHLSGWRRYGHKVRGRICLNRFATLESLEITPHNHYHSRVFSGLVPLLVVGDTYQRYQVANCWMSDFAYPVVSRETIILPVSGLNIISKWQEFILGGVFGDWLEAVMRRWQQARIRRDPRTYQFGSRVLIRDNELCLHPKKDSWLNRSTSS